MTTTLDQPMTPEATEPGIVTTILAGLGLSPKGIMIITGIGVSAAALWRGAKFLITVGKQLGQWQETLMWLGAAKERELKELRDENTRLQIHNAKIEAENAMMRGQMMGERE